MKYVLMFVETEQYAKDLAAMSETERDSGLRPGNGTGSPSTPPRSPITSTCSPRTPPPPCALDGSDPVITDGPFIEGKEIVSGFVEIEVADLDEALADGQDLARLPDRRNPPRLPAMTGGPCSQSELARVVRDHAGRLAASLVHLLGDFSAAEDLVQDAVEAALQRWPDEGHPRAARRVAVHRRPAPRPGRAAPPDPATGTNSRSCSGRSPPNPTTGYG